VFYLVNITLASGIRYYAERGGITFAGNLYEARVGSISNLPSGIDDSNNVTLVLANADQAVTAIDQVESFRGAKIEIIEYIDSISDGYLKWQGWSDEITSIDALTATLTCYGGTPTTRANMPKRTISLQCNWEFGKFSSTQTITDFDGFECPYQKTTNIGFVTTIAGASSIDNFSDPVTFVVDPLPNSQFFVQGDELRIGTERLLVTLAAGNTLTALRAQKGTTIAAHAAADQVRFANCQFSNSACQRRGMYGNNSADKTGIINNNYFGGFPLITGWQYHQVSFSDYFIRGLRPFAAFSGNDSAYASPIPKVYGRVRMANPIVLIAKIDDVDSNYTSALFAVCEGPLATNPNDETQVTPINAYLPDSVAGAYPYGIFVNGAHRHDPRANFGIQIGLGDRFQEPPIANLFPNVADFQASQLNFAGTAWLAVRIQMQNNPTVDMNANVSGQFDVAYGQIVDDYDLDPVTPTRKATTKPAWVLLDLMKSRRSGGGLDVDRIDIPSLQDVQAHNAELVTDTLNGGMVPRWTFNGTIDSQKSYSDWIRAVCLQMYCLPPYLGGDGKYKTRSLKAELLTGLTAFSSNDAMHRNIITKDGVSSLVKSRQSILQIPNELRVNFVQKSDFTKLQLVIADRDAQTQAGAIIGDNTTSVISKTVDLPGVSTIDEAARIATLILRAGEFAQGGLANNLQITFDTYYMDSNDLELGDIIPVTDDVLSPIDELYWRVVNIEDVVETVEGGGFLYGRRITATLHDNAIYDDTANTVSDFTRLLPNGAADAEPPAVTGFSAADGGIFDANNKPATLVNFNYSEPNPKLNFNGVQIFSTIETSPGSGMPDDTKWRDTGITVYNPGSAYDYPISGVVEFFAAVSRTLLGTVPNVLTLDTDGVSYKYPRTPVLIDGVTDVLPAPTGASITSLSHGVQLSWLPYTGTQLKLYKTFHIYRNSVNNFATATLLCPFDGTLFVDSTVSSATTYYYWVVGYSILNQEGTPSVALSTTAALISPTDAAVPDAPTIALINDELFFDSNQYGWLIVVSKPGGAANWNQIDKTIVQVSTDASFATFSTGNSLAGTAAGGGVFADAPPRDVPFSTKIPGVYFIRAKVHNGFGDSPWSIVLTRSTRYEDNIAADTDIPSAPDNLVVTKNSTITALGGNVFNVSFKIPTLNTQSYYGFSIYIHSSSTLPTATTQYSSFAHAGVTGSLSAGSNVLTCAGSPGFSPNVWAGKDLVVFGTHRAAPGSTTFDYEGQMFIVNVISNTSNTITFTMPDGLRVYTLSGLGFYIVNNGAGHHFFEKLMFTTPLELDESNLTIGQDLTSTRTALFDSAAPDIYVWVSNYNLLGQGRVTASPTHLNFAGLGGTAVARVQMLGSTGRNPVFGSPATPQQDTIVPGRTVFDLTSTDVSGGSIVARGAIQSATGILNASIGSIAAIAGNYVAITSGRTGSGTFLPLMFEVDAVEAMRIDINSGTPRLLVGLTSTDNSNSNPAVIVRGQIASATATSNAEIGSFVMIAGNYLSIAAGKTGSGAFHPIVLVTDGNITMSIKSSDADASTTAFAIWHGGSPTLKQVKTFADGLGHNVLYVS
jgi:hypothetical protein